MPRDRFVELLSNQHFVDNSRADTVDRLYKLRPVIDVLTEKCKSDFISSSDIITDESIWKLNGRLKFKQYNPKKHARFGIKVYRVCQSMGVAAG